MNYCHLEGFEVAGLFNVRNAEEEKNPHGIETVVSGTVQSILYRSEENGYTVMSILPDGEKRPISVVGVMPQIGMGERIVGSGKWTSDRRHGSQFKIEGLQIKVPTTLEGIEKFLSSGLIPGIGKVYAKKLVEAFGKNLLDTIEHHPEHLTQVEGLGPVRMAKLVEGYRELISVREISMFLFSHGVSSSNAVKIHKAYGQASIRTVMENPYRLATEIYGIGFLTADVIAGKLGISGDHPERVKAGIAYSLKESMDRGHCGMMQKTLVEVSSDLLGVDQMTISMSIGSSVNMGDLVKDNVKDTSGAVQPCVFLPMVYQAETGIAAKLSELNSVVRTPWSMETTEKSILEFSSKQNAEPLSLEQENAVRAALSSRVFVLTGGPGVGKTTTLNAILHAFKSSGANPVLCAPTGRAAKRMSESTGCEAKTIHRLLGFKPGGTATYNRENPIEGNPVIVDECSMVDVFLMNKLLGAIKPGSCLLLVGDVDQLPSVGPGEVLRSIISSGCVPVVKLTRIFRQAEGSAIIRNAHRINNRQPIEISPPGEKSDFRFVATNEPGEAVSKILKIVRERLPQMGFDPVRDVQVLSPMQKGESGVRNLNIRLQAEMNPSKDFIERFGIKYAVGDKIMQLKNNYEKDVFNGDIGFLKSIDREEQKVLIDFDGKKTEYRYNEMDELSLAYASTIHKSQGSEYPVVIMPIMTQHYPLLNGNPNLIYTGITRGKKLVVIVGQEKAIALAINNERDNRRITKLQDFIVELSRKNPSPATRSIPNFF